MYLLFITLGLCVLYAVLLVLFHAFFRQGVPPLKAVSAASVGIIMAASIASFFISFSIPDPEWGNRVMHALGGGVLTFLICFRVVRDSKIEVSRFQFFVSGFLIVASAGVGNEILEYFLQTRFGIMFSTNPFDTWRDLASNTVGALMAGSILTHFIAKHRT